MAFWCRGLALLVLPLLFLSPAAAGTRPSDVAALQGLLRAWQGTPELVDNWSLERDPCVSGWKGVVCCHSHTVIGLDLSKTGLTGIFPPEVGDLHNLRSLDLSGNPMLTGAIPKQIRNLHSLTKLKLSGCNLIGEIPPELNRLDKIKSLDLSNNPELSLDETSTPYSSLQQRYNIFFSSRRLLRHRVLLQAAPVPTEAIPAAPNALPPTAPTVSKLTSPTTTNNSSAGRSSVLPWYTTYIAIGIVAFVVLSIATCCFCRWRSNQKVGNGAQFVRYPG